MVNERGFLTFCKTQERQKVQIFCPGGSVTAQNGWRSKTLKWFQQKFPKAKVNQINAAIGGTDSDLEAFRVYQDALQYKPDLLFFELAVNDANAPPERIYNVMEGLSKRFVKRFQELWLGSKPGDKITFIDTVR